MPHRALVTGASAGIGAAFARELAAAGCDLVLTARREERLRTLATELRDKFSSDVLVLPADLARPDTVVQLLQWLEQHDVVPDILVNNAGYGVPNYLHDHPWEVHRDFIQVMMTAPTELAYRLLPGMQQRGFGRIINVASLAGHLPGSRGHTLYAAAKSYLIRFSQSLALENSSHGIHVCALCPGFTYSEFHDITGTRKLVSRMPRWMWMDAGRVAREGLAAVERGRIVYIPGRINRLVKTATKLLPDRLAMRVSDKQSRHYRARDPHHG